jgi:hypothetical protein
MRRFESSRPSQLISLRFLLFQFRHFQRSWERSWEIFVPLLISPRLVLIQFRDRIGRDLGITPQIMSGQDRLNITRTCAL